MVNGFGSGSGSHILQPAAQTAIRSGKTLKNLFALQSVVVMMII
jgi:hypothetical protein